jgi:release factor glutamine methyltransferase
MPHSLFTPSEHTAALLLYIRNTLAKRTMNNALEIGTGSGVVIASLLASGAKQAMGVDVEALGVQATQELLLKQGLDQYAKQFDVIVTNLPQFAAQAVYGDGRLPTWSAGGADGRKAVDQFLKGLAKHLTLQGSAVMTHNVFLDLQKTRSLLKADGMRAEVVYTASAPLSQAKLTSMTQQVREQYTGHGLYPVGEFWFSDFYLLEISHEGASQHAL